MNVIDDFLQYKAKNTQRNYTWILKEYFKEIKQEPDTYFKTERDYKKDINQWWTNHLDEVPTTRNTKLNILKSFFDEYEILFPKKFWVKLRRMRKGNRPATMDRVPSPTEFKKILQHGTIKDKSVFLFTASSGMRINEVLQIKPEHIDLKHDPPRINIPGSISKTGDPRITFISYEAKEYLEMWLSKIYTEEDEKKREIKVSLRDIYLKQAIAKTKQKYKTTRKNDAVFPFHYNIAWTRWAYLIKKAKLDDRDPTTNRYVLHIHCLRKYFLSQLKLKIPSIIAEALAGHEEYLDQAYRRYTKQQLAEFYKKGMENVTILETQPDLTGIHEQLKEKDTEIQELNKRLNDLRLDMMEIQIELGKEREK